MSTNKLRKYIETNHCVALMQRLSQYHPDIYEQIYHVPNENTVKTHTNIGIKPGQPDYCIPIPHGIFGALYIEMKKPSEITKKNGGLSDSQVGRHKLLAK